MLSVAVVVEVAAFVAAAVGELNFIVMLHLKKKRQWVIPRQITQFSGNPSGPVSDVSEKVTKIPQCVLMTQTKF